MRFLRVARGATLLVVLLALVTACSGVDDRDDDGYIGGQKKITLVEPADRVVAPEISGQDLDGADLSTADFDGKILVLNLWGSWCPPCRAEAPVLRAVSEESGDGVQFLGLLHKDKPTAAKAFNAKAGITYPSLYDPAGEYQLAFVDSLPSQAIPTTWIIDSHGKVAARIIDDKLTEATLRGVIDQVKKTTP